MRDLAEGRYKVFALHCNVLRTEAVRADVSEKAGASVELKLQPLASEVSGRIVGSDGKPIEGAKVTLSNHDVPGTSFTATTDADGRFVLRNVPPGNYHVSGEADGRAKVQKGHTQFRSAMTDLNFTLPKAATIVGRVVFPPDKEPPRFLLVSTVEPGSDPGEPAEGGFTSAWALVSGDGSYRLTNLMPGTYILRLVVEGKVVDKVTVTVGEGEEVTAPELSLKTLSAQAKGTR